MIRRPPKSTRTDSLLPYPTLCRSRAGRPQAVITTNPPAATLARDRARDRERTGDDDKFHDECGVFGVFGHEDAAALEIGRAHVCTPATNAHLVCRLLLEQKQQH